MTTYRFLPLALLLVGLAGCDQIKGLLGGDDAKVTEAADAKLKQNDLPGAVDEYAKIAAANPDSLNAAQGLAYASLLKGDYAAADKALATAESKVGDGPDKDKQLGEIKVRRAIVALRKGDLDAVKQHGEASKMPVGLVLAAEVHLADAESDQAKALLKQAAADPGVVGKTAKTYVDMLESGDPMQQGLAEATALWSLGQRDVAVEAAEELVKALPEDRADKNELLLVWAGRAVTAGRPAIAEGMLDAMGPPPEGQAWRVQATRGMIRIANGENEEGIAIFAALAEGGAPADGLSDALATAAALAKDQETAAKLAGSVESVAAARGLYQAGAVGAAKQVAPAGSGFTKFLETK